MEKVVPILLTGAGLSTGLLAQEARAPGLLKPAAQIEAELAQSVSELGVVAGQSTRVFETGAGRVVVRRREAGPNNASVHPDLTEIYYIVDGAGTFVTGGEVSDPENRSAGITGGVAQRVEAGDFVILPPGTPHWFSHIEGSITYMETRFAATE